MSTNDGNPNTMIQPDVCAAAALDYERRIAELRAKVTRLEAILSKPTGNLAPNNDVTLLHGEEAGLAATASRRTMRAQAKDERIAELEAKYKAKNDYILDLESDLEHQREGMRKLEAEVKRLKARLVSEETEWALRCQTIGREADRHCATVTKLGWRLGRLKKRRRKELAEFEDILGRHKLSEHALTALLEKRTVQVNVLEQLIADAYDNGVLDSRHAHAAIAAHATVKGVSDDKPHST